MTNPIDECLSERDGRLYIEELDATALLMRFGSPLFVFSEDQLRRNVRRFQRSFSQGWDCGPVTVMPAVKANWAQAIQAVLADEGCGADIYSEGELEVALRVGIDPAQMSVNGVPKSLDHIDRALEVGARITVDSLRDVDILEDLTCDGARSGRVALRLRPTVSDFNRPSGFVPQGLAPTDLVALMYKGGLSTDEAIEAGRRIADMRGLSIVGFHQHHGRHHPSTDLWSAQMRAYGREIGRVSRALGNLRPQEIDIGGGFAIPRDPHNAATDYLAPLQLGALYAVSWGLKALGRAVRYRLLRPLLSLASDQPNQRAAPSIEDYAAATTRALRDTLDAEGLSLDGVRLQLEPGRSIHGNAGVHLASVQALKSMDAPVPWRHVVIDTSEFWLAGGRFEHHLHDYVVANKMNAPIAQHADVTGRSCYGDRLLGRVPLPELEVGDVLALLDTGAYQEVSASNFNAMARPASILVNGEEAHVIRRAETMDDVFRRDRVPEHLRPKGRAPGDRAAE
ncbi:MAG: hypothetical protein AAF799_20750 [Myxococcota bacterium]